jgi:hypothetical protein
MSAVASKSRAGRRKANPGQPEFSERSYKEYLAERSKIHNDVARKNRNTSIFDSMAAVDGEFKKKIYDGMSIDDMFNNLK